MDSRYRLLFATVLLAVAGCSETTDGYRTYDAGADDSAATVEDAGLPPSAEAGLSAGLNASAEASAPEEVAEPATAAERPSPPPMPSTVPSSAAPVAAKELDRPPRVPLRIRIAWTGLNGDSSSLTSIEGSTEPREIKLLVPEKDFPRIDSGKTLRVTYDDLDLLKILNMEPVPVDCAEHFPDWLRKLDGMQIRIRGFMYPPDRATELPGFVLARDNQICCFGRDPKVYDIIPVFLKDGTTTDYIPNRPFDVVGRLYIRPDSYRGKIQNLYEIEEAEVVTR